MGTVDAPRSGDQPDDQALSALVWTSRELILAQQAPGGVLVELVPSGQG